MNYSKVTAWFSIGIIALLMWLLSELRGENIKLQEQNKFLHLRIDSLQK